MPTCNICHKTVPWPEINYGFHYEGKNVCLACWPDGAFAPMCWLPSRYEMAPELQRIPDYLDSMDASVGETVAEQMCRECPDWIAEEAEQLDRERHEGITEINQMEGIK